MNAPDGIRFRSKDERTLPLYALMNKAVNDYIKAITHICENDALDKCADILELHGWTKQRTCHITLKFTCSECGHQYPTRNFEYYETCDGRTAMAPLGYNVLDCARPNFCPNCGAKVVR